MLVDHTIRHWQRSGQQHMRHAQTLQVRPDDGCRVRDDLRFTEPLREIDGLMHQHIREVPDSAQTVSFNQPKKQIMGRQFAEGWIKAVGRQRGLATESQCAADIGITAQHIQIQIRLEYRTLAAFSGQ
ncbi:hypothetical protein D3C81_1718370 [compost metagenome]